MRIRLWRNKANEFAIDPVCHMEVPLHKPPGGSRDHLGTMYYFCGPGCSRALEKDPDAYISGEKRLEM